MDYITYIKSGQVVKLTAQELLQDKRFEWRFRKVKTVRLAELYDLAGMPVQAERARTCATWVQFAEAQDGGKQLMAANFCQLRMCPMCSARRAKKSAFKLSQVLDMVEAVHGAKFLFVTLTMKNVPGSELGAALIQLTEAWNRLLKQRHMERVVRGWFRAIEITRKKKGYHPHLHIIFAVSPDYFSKDNRKAGGYLHQADLIDRWQKALRVDYRPSVDIRTAKGKAGTGEAIKTSGGRAALEAAKYAVKDEEYIDPKLPEQEAVQILTDYTVALHRRRLTAFGGWMKDAARALDADNLEDDSDLVHIDEDSIREDVAELIAVYSWHFGAGDYVLASRTVNPLKLKQENQERTLVSSK